MLPHNGAAKVTRDSVRSVKMKMFMYKIVKNLK